VCFYVVLSNTFKYDVSKYFKTALEEQREIDCLGNPIVDTLRIGSNNYGKMKASSLPEKSQLQQGPSDSFSDLEKRLKQKLKQKQEERQLRRSTSSIPASSTEQDAVGDGGPNEITITDTLVTAENGNPSSSDGVMKGKTQDGNEDQRPVPSSDRSSSKQQLVPASNGSLDGERRRNTDHHHHRSRHGSRGRGNSPPSQKREWPYYPSHPRSAGGPPWNIIRDDFGRAMPSQFHEDPHHPSHFYDPYYDGPPPPYYHHHHHPPPPRGGDYYMRDPYYGASPRGGPPLDPHNYPPHPRGSSGGRYRDRSYDGRRGPTDFDGSRRSWDLQQPLVSAAAASTDDAAAAAAAVLQSKSSSSRVARSRSRSIASSSRSDHLSQNSYSAESEDNLSSGRRRSHRHSSPSYSSSRSSASSRASFSSDDTGQSRSKGKARTKHSKHRREDRNKRKRRAKSHKRRRDVISHDDEDEKPSISTVLSKGSDDESKNQSERLNGKPKDAVIPTVKEDKDNLSSSHEAPPKRPSRSASFDDKKTPEEAEAIKRRQHDAESMSKRKRKKYKRSSRTSRSRSQSSSSVNSDSSSRSSRSTPSRCKTKESNNNDMLGEESEDQSAVTKDLRTIFISQLVMRATEHDVRKFLRKYVGVSKVKQVIFLQDKRTGRHKGCSYVELGKLSDVKKALEYDGKIPSFQRFPILIKPSEGDKNYSSATGVEFASTDESAITASAIHPSYSATSMPSLISTIDSRGKKVVLQNVYIGSIDRLVTQAQLQAIFSQFGPLKNLHLPLDPATGLHRGYAFLSYSDAKSANLAIKTMAGQSIAGRQL